MIKIVCTSCQKPLSLDETKLPMKEVSFPCPVCKTKLTVDRRNLNAAPAPAAPAEISPPAPSGEEEEEGFGAKALLVGADHPGLRQAAKLIGFVPVSFPAAQREAAYVVQDFLEVAGAIRRLCTAKPSVTYRCPEKS